MKIYLAVLGVTPIPVTETVLYE